MRQISLLVCLFFVVGGCQSKWSDTLSAADSLMVNRPDSAYVLLKSIDPLMLSNQDQRAHYALLYTQAQHKHYELFASDSLIDIAVNYYKKHGSDRQKMQALMYKGVVLNEIGLPHEAMQWYKQAEKVNDSTNYITLGLLNIRMGDLYRKMYIANKEYIDKYKQAFHYFRLANDSKYVAALYRTVGHSYLLTDRDSTYLYLDLADSISVANNYTRQLSYNKQTRAHAYYIDKQYVKSKDLSLDIINTCNNSRVKEVAYDCLARSYANLGRIDSALYYIKSLESINTPEMWVSYYSTLIEIEKNRGNYKAAFEYNQKAEKLSDSITKEAAKADLYQIEKRYDKTIVETLNQELEVGNQLRSYIITICVLFIVLLVVVAYVIIRRKDMLNREKLFLIEQLQRESQHSKSLFAAKLDSESKLKLALENQIKSIRQLIDLSYRSGGDTEKFMDKFRESVRVNQFSDGMWRDLKYMVNEQYGGIIHYLTTTYPQLSEDDLNFLSLMCCDFSYIEMAVCFGYVNERSTYSRRAKLASKMGITIPLDEYIRQQISSTRS